MNTDLWTPLPDDVRSMILKRMLHGLTGLDAWRVPRWIYGIVCASKTSGALFRDPTHTIWKDLCGLLGLTELHWTTWKQTFRGTVLDLIVLDGLLQHSCVFPRGIVAPCIEGVDLARVKTTLPLSIPVGKYSVKLFARRLSVLRHVEHLIFSRAVMRRAEFAGNFVASFDAGPCFRHADQDPMPQLYFLFGVAQHLLPQHVTLNFGRGLKLHYVRRALVFFEDVYKVPHLAFEEQIGYDRRLQRAASAPLTTGPPDVAPVTGQESIATLAAAHDAIAEGGAPQTWAYNMFQFPLLLAPQWDVIDEAFPGHLEALFTMLTIAGLDDRVKEKLPCRIRDLLSRLTSWRSEFVDTLPTLDAYAA